MAVEWLWWRMGEAERASAGNGDGGAPELRWRLRLRARTKEEAEIGNEGARRERTDAGELKARSGLALPRRAGRRRRAASHWRHTACGLYSVPATERCSSDRLVHPRSA